MQCANPMCDVETLYFRCGSLHTIDYFERSEAGDLDVKRRIIWLCGECSPRFAVEVWRPPGQQLRSQLVAMPVSSPQMRHSADTETSEISRV